MVRKTGEHWSAGLSRAQIANNCARGVLPALIPVGVNAIGGDEWLYFQGHCLSVGVLSCG